MPLLGAAHGQTRPPVPRPEGVRLPWRGTHLVITAEAEVRFGRCVMCGRALVARESQVRGFGPTCAQDFGLDICRGWARRSWHAELSRFHAQVAQRIAGAA